jgi:putative membrane protein
MMNGMMNGPFGANNSAINGFCNSGVFGMPLSTLLLAGLVILVVYLFLKTKNQPSKKEPIFINDKASILDAAEIVRLRYARGEISFEEFQTILKNIQS